MASEAHRLPPRPQPHRLPLRAMVDNMSSGGGKVTRALAGAGGENSSCVDEAHIVVPNPKCNCLENITGVK